jgi:hypothetical protein
MDVRPIALNVVIASKRPPVISPFAQRAAGIYTPNSL